MGSSFNVLTQSLAVLGQPMQNFTEPLFRHILVHQELLRALVPASQLASSEKTSERKNGGKREGESSTSGFQVITSSLLFTNSESKWVTNNHCSLLSPGLYIHDRVVEVCLESLVGTLRSAADDGNEDDKQAIGLIVKTTILHVYHAFLCISLPPLHDYDIKMPSFTSTEEVHKRRPNFLYFSELGYGSWEFNFRRVHFLFSKLVTWSKRDEDWKNANSLFLCRLHCRRRPRILKSLYFATADWVQFCWLRVQKFTDLTLVGRIDESTARRLSLPIHEQEGGDRWHFRLRRCWKRVVSGRKPDDGVIFLRAGSRVKGVDIN